MFLERLRQHAMADPAGIAIIGEASELSNARLLARVVSDAANLRAQGIGPGAVVGLAIADEVEHLIATLSLFAAGANHITLASHDSETLRTQIAARVGTTHVVGEDSAAAIAGLPFVRWSRVTDNGSAIVANGQGTILLKTSGTTGDMNVVEFSQRQIAGQASRHLDYAGQRLLRLAAIEHNNSKRHRLYCVWAGGTNVFRPAGALNIADYCRKHAVTCLDISRMHASSLAVAGLNGALEGIRLRTGGSAIPIDVRRDVEQHVTRQLYVRYAATECGAIAMAGPGEHDDDETVGVPLPGVELEIVGHDGEVLPAGESGEIRLRAAGMATGYFNSPAETAKRFRDGWFWPGDMGTVRADGRLIVNGRKDDMMILNGLNIFPAEIERVLERHAAVSVAAALGVPSKVHGQIPVAAVELKQGAVVSPSELQSYARQHLALRAPRKIIVMDALPRNSQGKIVRRQIATAFAPAGPAQ